MAKQQGMAMAAAVVVVALLLAETASAASCNNVAALSPCAPALSSGAAPSGACCSSLKAQQGCFCQYAKNPSYARYINSPNARKIVASCGISLPRC